MKLYKYIAKKTKKIRYKIVKIFLKILTPNLYKYIDIETFTNRSFKLKLESIERVIRPAIKFMKEYFKQKVLNGCEIGIATGINSQIILKELNIKKFYLIDIWDNYDGYKWLWSKHNYELVKKKFQNDARIIIKKDYSKNVVKEIKDNSLDFIYIDGNHQYDFVYQDISLWYSKIKINGIISGHDISLPEVINAVKDYCNNNEIEYIINPPDWYFIKEKELKKKEI